VPPAPFAFAALTAVATSFGPWGAYEVSVRSQTARLESLLARHRMLSGGRVARASEPVPLEDIREISAVVDYLASAHGPESLDRLADREPGRRKDIPRWRQDSDAREAFMKAMGLEYVRPWESPTNENSYYAKDHLRDVEGYERLFDCYFYRDVQTVAKGYWARLDANGRSVEILEGPTKVLAMPVGPLLEHLASLSLDGSRTVPPADLCLAAQSERLRARACFLAMTTRQEGEEERAVWTANGYVLIDEHP